MRHDSEFTLGSEGLTCNQLTHSRFKTLRLPRAFETYSCTTRAVEGSTSSPRDCGAH